MSTLQKRIEAFADGQTVDSDEMKNLLTGTPQAPDVGKVEPDAEYQRQVSLG